MLFVARSQNHRKSPRHHRFAGVGLQIFLACGVLAGVLVMLRSAWAVDEIRFNRDIRPLLSDRCFKCHGPDAGSRKGQLRLDRPEGALHARGERPAVIVPSDAQGSLILERISSTNPEQVMPPPDSGKELDAAEIETIRKWIEAGAEWQGHWAFLPPRRPELPALRTRAGVRNPVDVFIRKSLEREGLVPSPEADRRTLVRRLAFDLTGLPPSPLMVERFVEDAAPDAYERLCDTLLKSPEFGEHFGRYWLDVARYGDTHGLHLDNKRSIWPYRDWVIRAFNRNMPFDQFTVDQLAGDLLPNPTQDQLVATGFNRCNVTTSEGGSIAEEVAVRYAVDRVETTSTVWMALTSGCAVCHDHKFDPLTQKDFYGLFAFFNNLTEAPMDGNELLPPPTIPAPSEDEQKQIAALTAAIDARYRETIAPIPELDAQQESWERERIEQLSDLWRVATPVNARATSGAELAVQEDGTVVAPGSLPPKDTYEVSVRVAGQGLKAIRLDIFRDDALVNGGPGFASNGNFVLSEFEATAVSLEKPAESRPIAFREAIADFVEGGMEPAKAIDGSRKDGWAIHGGQGSDRALFLFARESFGYEGGTEIRVRLHQEQGNHHRFKRFRLSVSDRAVDDRVVADVELERLAAIARDARSEEQRSRVREVYRAEGSPEWRALKTELDGLRRQLVSLKISIPKTLVMQERAERRDTFILVRGEYDTKGEKVLAGVPQVFSPLPESSLGTRLDLARWLVDPKHPLTSRVTINRIWQRIFGTGLVKTSEDFGAQGDWPSHPALLDWLAMEFVRREWNVQDMVRLLVTSATYRQSSVVSEELLERDRENRLLARGPRFRIEAEMLRDNALAVSGLLVRRIGGPGVRPYQPDGLWKAVAYTDSNTAKFVQDHGDKLYRRAVYTFWKRTMPPPAMAIFDAPTREACVVKRARTNTPLQALVLMNDPQFVECARWLAQRVMHEGGDDNRSRIDYLYRVVLARLPRIDEAGLLEELLGEYLREYRSDLEAAQRVCAAGEAPRADRGDPAALASWTIISNLVLNLDESVTKG
jgi:hypothetical protein